MQDPGIKYRFFLLFFLALFSMGSFAFGFTTTIQVDSVSCNGNSDGKIVATVSGGTAPYIFTWNTGQKDTTNFPADSLINLPAGNYWVVIDDANASDFHSIEVYEPDPVSIDLQLATDVTCFGAGDGEIDINASGGTPEYYYSIDGGSSYFNNGGHFTGLAPGNYVVSVMDSHGCSVAGDTLTINEPPAITIDTESETDVTCHGGNDGTITVSASGGTSPYVFSIDGGISFQDNGGSFSGLTAGDYQIAVRDANGCVKNGNPVTVNEPPAIGITFLKTDVTCYGGSDGSISITASDGTSPYAFSIDGGTSFQNNGGNYTGLTAGSYDLAVRDADGCVQNGPAVNINEPPQLVIQSQTKTDVTCYGADDGTITLTATGGTPSYTWSVDGGTTFQDNGGNYTGLAPGNYNIAVKDSHGCEQNGNTLTINEPTQLVIQSQTKTDVTCHGADDGTITINASGASPPYIYSTDGGTTYMDNGGKFTGLTPGNYDIAVKDSHGCVQNGTTLTITEPAVLDVTTTAVTGVTCHGGSDGAISVTVSGGTPPYGFAWSGPGGYTSVNQDINGLKAGDYYLTVTDANGCTYDHGPVTVNEPDAIGITYVSTDVDCHGGSNGTISITASGGTSPYVFSIDGGASFRNNGGNYTGLTAGSYSLAVRDTNGCVQNGPVVNINEPPQLVITSQTKTDITCYGAADGTITLTATGGAPPYTWFINGDTTFQDNGGIYTGLPPGNYDVAVRDSHGCVQNGNTLTITEPAQLVILSFSKTDATCYGAADGTVTITVTGGTSPYTYSIDGGVTYSSNGGIFNGISAGTYPLAVKDANGCMAAGGPVTVSEPTAITFDAISHTDVTCHGGHDGSITVSVSGGTAPYTYSIDGGVTFENNGGAFTGLVAGSYPLAVRDGNGCTRNGDTVTLIEPPAMQILSLTKKDISCHGLTDGSIDITVSGGTPPWQYSIDGGTTYSADHLFTGLPAGDYDILIRDANGCLFYGKTLTIIDPPLLLIDSVAHTDVLCAGGNSGTIRIFASGGTGTLEYSVNNGTSFYSNNGIFDRLPAGSYIPVVQDTNGCTATGPQVVLSEPPALALTIDTIKPSCNSHSFDGTISLQAGGGSGGYFYSIDSGRTFVSGGIFTGLEGGHYYVATRDANGCILTDSVDLIGKINVMAYAGRDTGTCPGTTIQLHASGGDSYQWEPAASLNDPGIPDPVASPGETTNYVVTVTTGVCYDQDTVVVTVFPVHGIDAGRDTVILNGTSVTLTASGEGFVSYLWYPPDGLESNTGQSVVARPDKDIVYYVNGTTQEGCVETDSIKIMLIKEIFIPSGFTPNGDGKNDTWHFGHMEFYPDITVEVFNRWGERVFYSKGYDSSREWNGIYKGKALPSGTYYYVINLNDPKHTPPLTGPVTIMR